LILAPRPARALNLSSLNPHGMRNYPGSPSFSGIRDIRKRRVPCMQNKVSLNWRLRFLDWRRWDLDCILREIWVRVRLLYTFIFLWINGFGRSGNGRSISNKSTVSSDGFSSPFGLAMVLLRRDPDPEVEAVFISKRLAIMFLISLVWLDKKV
nr:hypothetical protein [Tanacetum cinerariifolium]